MTPDFLTHWQHAAVRVSILLTVGTLVVALCIRCARRKINPAGQSLLWLSVLVLGLCWFTLPIDQPAWWPDWESSTATSHLADATDPETSPSAERNEHVALTPTPASNPSVDDPIAVGTSQDDPRLIPSTPDAFDEGSRFPSEADSALTATAGGVPVAPDARSGADSIDRRASITRSLFIAWIVAIAGVMALFASQHISLLRTLKRSATLPEESLRQLHQQLSERTATQSELFISSDCSSPLLVGIIRPRIWLPIWVTELSEESQRAVLAHEMAHIARRDGWTTLIALASNVACWFHPLAWWARSRMCATREQAADEWAITRAGCTPVAYAKALVDVAERMPTHTLVTLPAMSIAKSELHQRVVGVLDAKPPTRLGRPLVAAIIVGLIAVNAVSAGGDTERNDAPSTNDAVIESSENVDPTTQLADSTGADEKPLDPGVELDGDPLLESATAAMPPDERDQSFVDLVVDLPIQDDAASEPPQSDAELVASLREAWREWQIGTAYKGNYEFWSGSLDDQPEVDLSSIDFETDAHVSHRARGFVCKDGFLYRVSWYPERDADIRTDTSHFPDAPGGGQVGSFLDMDFDEATNGALWIRSNKYVQNEHTIVYASAIPEEQLQDGLLPRPGIMGMGAHPLPTLPVPATIAFPDEYPVFDSAEYEVVRLDENRVRLQAQREMHDEYASRHTCTVDWWLAPEVPVIERAFRRSEHRWDGQDEVHEQETRFADFRICDGLRVPARITCLSRGGIVNADGEPVQRVSIRHWVCEDLGDESPLEIDFAIPIDAAHTIIHTRNPKRFREQGQISILKITTDDLLQIGDTIGKDAAPPR